MPVLDLEKLLQTPYVDPYRGYDISPDGEWAVFSWNKTGEWELYEVALFDHNKIRQITTGEGGKFAPLYHPSGSQIAYVLDEDGSESFNVYFYDRDSQEHRNITAGIEGAIQPNLSWSPEGNRLALIANQTGCFHTYILTLSSGDIDLVLDEPFHDWDVAWSPDGRYLAVEAETTGQDYGVFILPVEGETPIRLSEKGETLNAQQASWHPEDNLLAFSSDADGRYRIGIFDLEASDLSWLPGGEYDDKSPQWSPDGEQIVFERWKGPKTSIAVVSLADGEVLTPATKTGVHYHPQFTPDGEHILYIFDSADQPRDLWLFLMSSGDAVQLTDSLPEDLRGSQFFIPEEISYPGEDGEQIPALLFLPEETSERTPAVIYIHGGPNWLSQITWYPEVQHFVSRGWVVLAPNYRGSIGFGREWQLANRYDLGGVDTRDVAAGRKYLIDNQLADPERIAVTGRSHGGYLTMTCLTQYPEFWAAGSAVVPFLNWFTSHENAREDLQHWDLENMGDPDENESLWYERSPFFFLDQIQAPVQLICGANDPRCPASESVMARDKLLSINKEVDLQLYPGEGHAFLKTENVLDAEQKRVAFLSQALEK